jgi:hypothetical protein
MGFRQSALIDVVCDEFEQAWVVGEAPQIENYMNRAGEESRMETFRELLKVEIELRRSANELVKTADYLNRFPGLESVIIDAFG